MDAANRVGHRVENCRCLFRQVSKCRHAVISSKPQRKRREGDTGRLNEAKEQLYSSVEKPRQLREARRTSDTVSTRSRAQQFTSFLYSITCQRSPLWQIFCLASIHRDLADIGQGSLVSSHNPPEARAENLKLL